MRARGRNALSVSNKKVYTCIILQESWLKACHCTHSINREWYLGVQMWVSQTLVEKTSSTTWNKQDHYPCYFLEQNIHYVKWKRKKVLFILVEARLNYVLKLLLPKCFIVQKLSGWFYHTDGKRCAFCLTCGNKPLEIRTNDFTRIGTFEIILSHCCLFIWLCLRQDSKQFNKLWVTNFKKLCMTKKKVIFAAALIYLNYTVDNSFKLSS